MIKHKSTRSKGELEGLAEQALLSMPSDTTPAELAYVLSCMLKGHSLALKKEETL